MRVGIVTIPFPLGDKLDRSVVDRTLHIAREVERLGFAGLWVTDAFGRGQPTLDPLNLLSAASAVTERIELGTCVAQIPIRHPVEHAHRVMSLQVLSAGRLTFGVGSGSTRSDFDAVQADYESRFRALPEALEVMRRTWSGEAVYGPALSPWPGTVGGPPVVLGAWRSRRWIQLAAQSLQGWMASGIHTTWEDIEIGARMYRDAGGTRAMVANIFTDPSGAAARPGFVAHANLTLIGNPKQARADLRRLADLGVDDALLVAPFDAPEQLEAIRALF